ncbi:ribonuclease [Sphingomonas sp.]|uniref:ribonuclease n=1 Tax=Sphingomonas sp. TaxID=28214 RepID=UPI0038B1523E
MAEWLVERGVGETRAALLADGEIIEARIELEGVMPAGSVIAARLTSIGSNDRNAVAVAEGGDEYLLPKGASGITEGAVTTLEVTREAIPGAEPWKRPLARITDEPPRAAPGLGERLGARALSFPAPADELGQAGWNDLLDEARSGTVAFAGGELRISPTPAMTLIDVDGYLPPDELAVIGAAAAAKAIRRLDIGGSIGIDLPTAGSKAARQAAAAAIDAHLPQPFERTAINGFGFVQIVRPWSRASLIQLAHDRTGFETRALLRRAAFERAGGKRIVAQPAIIALLELRREWIDTLSRQVGGTVELRADATLPMSDGYAENL